MTLPTLELLDIFEIVATILGVGSVYLLSMGNGRGWVPGAVCILLMGVVYVGRDLHGSAVLQLYFLPTQYVGWRRWKSGQKEDLRQSSRFLSWAYRVKVLALIVLGWSGVMFILKQTGGQAIVIDAFVTTGSVAAQTLMVLGFRECWLLWIVVDLIYVGLMAHQQLWAFALLYLLFTAIAINGWREWTRESSH